MQCHQSLIKLHEYYKHFLAYWTKIRDVQKTNVHKVWPGFNLHTNYFVIKRIFYLTVISCRVIRLRCYIGALRFSIIFFHLFSYSCYHTDYFYPTHVIVLIVSIILMLLNWQFLSNSCYYTDSFYRTHVIILIVSIVLMLLYW